MSTKQTSETKRIDHLGMAAGILMKISRLKREIETLKQAREILRKLVFDPT